MANWECCILEDLDIAKKRKPKERNQVFNELLRFMT